MLHLLLQNDKEVLRKEYHIRVAVITLCFVLCTVIAAALLLLPSYMLTGSKERVALQTAEQLQIAGAAEKDEEATALLREYQGRISLLFPEKESVAFSALVNVISEDAPETITLQTFSYAKDGEGAVSVTVSGMAKTRESLVAFAQVVGNESVFAHVDLPVSNLAKDKDIPFSFNITVK